VRGSGHRVNLVSIFRCRPTSAHCWMTPRSSSHFSHDRASNHVVKINKVQRGFLGLAIVRQHSMEKQSMHYDLFRRLVFRAIHGLHEFQSAWTVTRCPESCGEDRERALTRVDDPHGWAAAILQESESRRQSGSVPDAADPALSPTPAAPEGYRIAPRPPS